MVLHPQKVERESSLEDQEHLMVLAPQEQNGGEELENPGQMVRQGVLLEDQEHQLVLTPPEKQWEEVKAQGESKEVKVDGEVKKESLLEMMRRKEKEHQEKERLSTTPGTGKKRGGRGSKNTPGNKIEKLTLKGKQEKNKTVMTMVKALAEEKRKEQTYEEWKEARKRTSELGSRKRKAESDDLGTEFDNIESKRVHHHEMRSGICSRTSEKGQSKNINNQSENSYNQGGRADHVRGGVGGHGGEVARDALNIRGSNWLTRLGAKKKAT